MATICYANKPCQECSHYRKDPDRDNEYSCFLATDLKEERAYDNMYNVLNDANAQ